MSLHKPSSLLLLLFSLLAISFAQDCTVFSNTYNCTKMISCTTTTGVCECANGKRCVWTNSGEQTINCPCFAAESDTYDILAQTSLSDPFKYCINKFAENKCGYETTCSFSLDTGTCKCADGSTNCVWNGATHPNCPCDTNSYPPTTEYITQNQASCATSITTNNCPSNSVIRCVQGIGSCQCTDGSVCAWGPTYKINCPCV